VQQPQRRQHRATTAQRFTALRPVAVCALLLLSLMASLWQGGQYTPRAGTAQTHTAAGEERTGGETQLEEESPAKLRRLATLRAPNAAQPYQANHRQTFPISAVLRHSLIPAAPGQPRHSLPSQRQQRGQAPPLA